MVDRGDPVIAEAEFIDQSWREGVGLTQDEVFGEIGVRLTTEAAAVEDRSQRKSIGSDLMPVTVASVGLVLLIDIPIDALVPLDDVVRLAQVDVVVVVRLPRGACVGVGVEVKNALCDAVDLARAEDIVLSVAG